LAFNIVAAELKKELHGEKMLGVERSPLETLTCWQRQVPQEGAALKLHCGNI
jgi:hypothetical protein